MMRYSDLAQQSIDGYRDDARLDGAKKRRRPVDSVGQANQDALLALNAKTAQQIAEPSDPLRKLTIAPGPARSI